MEKRSIGLWQFVGFGVVSLLGTLLHFLFDWAGGTVWSAIFSAVNESTWEHMKLLFFPLLIFAVVEWFFFGDIYTAFWCVKLKGTLLGMILIPTIFYTLNGVFGKTPDWVNISIFFVTTAIVFLYEYVAFIKEPVCLFPKLAFGILCLVALLFIFFTFKTPNIPLFQDPITGTYGYQG